MFRALPIIASITLGMGVTSKFSHAIETTVQGASINPVPVYAPPGPYPQYAPGPGAYPAPYYYGRPVSGGYGTQVPAPVIPEASQPTLNTPLPEAAASESIGAGGASLAESAAPVDTVKTDVAAPESTKNILEKTTDKVKDFFSAEETVEADNAKGVVQPNETSSAPVADVSVESRMVEPTSTVTQKQTKTMTPESPAIAESFDKASVESAGHAKSVETSVTTVSDKTAVSSTTTDLVTPAEKPESGNLLESTGTKFEAILESDQGEPEVDAVKSTESVASTSVEPAAGDEGLTTSTEQVASPISTSSDEQPVAVATVDIHGATSAEQQLIRLKVLQDLADEGIISADEELSIRRRVLNAR